MGEGNWVAIGPAAALEGSGRMAAAVGGTPVLILRQDGQLYALLNRCPHLSCPLTRGALDGYILTCPCHDWRFDIRTGAFEYAGEIILPIYACRETAGQVYVRI